ncbi:MAG: hypothetical protein MOB07_04870 [Acidobacteria bacterium]|nr:hypothetical protein [Acidobacteriota bacterium]
MLTVKVTPGAIAWPCPDCDGQGIVPEYLQEFYHGARAGRRGDDYCETCLMQGHCPVCGGEAMWDEKNECFNVCPGCGHDVERVGCAVEREAFENATGARRLSSAIDPGGRLILRYLMGGLFIEFKVFGDLLCYKRSYWRKQALTEAAQAMIEAFDAKSHRSLSPCFSEEMFEDMREAINDLDTLKRAAEIVMKAYDAMPYDRPFGRGLNSSHFDRLKDALSAF